MALDQFGRPTGEADPEYGYDTPPVHYVSGLRGRVMTTRPREEWGDWPGRQYPPVPRTADWYWLGWAPTPTGGRFRRAQRHLAHGILMGYPLRHVLGFTLRMAFRKVRPRQWRR